MKSEIKYELPMFSSNLENEPQIEFKNMNVKITIMNTSTNETKTYHYEDTDNGSIKLVRGEDGLEDIVTYQITIYSNHNDCKDEELKKINEEDFSFWKPKHYSLYLDGFGMYQFIAQSLEVEK